MVLISLNVCLMVVYGILKFVSRSFIEEACVVPLAPTAMTMSGSTFHHKSIMLFKRGWYLWMLLSIASCENLSLQYVNPMNWIVRSSGGFDGGLLLYGCLFTQRIYGLDLALH